jgi:hypothetical protein
MRSTAFNDPQLDNDGPREEPIPMFDYLHCQCALPGLDDPTSLEFQTKDLDCCMAHYTITADGRLVTAEYRTEDHSDPTGDAIERISGMLTRIKTGDRDIEFHGMLNFYGSRRTGSEWFEYFAKFTDGKLVSVRRQVEVKTEEEKCQQQRKCSS